MRASEQPRRARRSQFVPTCATSRWLACWLLALAACLNPVPDTDPSVTANDSPAAGGNLGPSAGQGDPSVDDDDALLVDPEESEPPANSPQVPAGAFPDAGAPPTDAGADAAPGGPQ